MSRIRRYPLIAAGVGLVAVIAALVIAAVASGQAGFYSEPSEEEVAASVTALRATVTVIYPRFDEDPPDPEFYGPFWLYPAGYEGEWPAVPTFEPCPRPSVNMRDSAVIRAADIYVEVEPPPGLTLAEPVGRSACGARITEMVWKIEGTPGGIEVVRARPGFPYAIGIPPRHSWLEVEKTSVGGLPAVFLRAKPGEAGTVMIYFADDTYVTGLTGSAPAFDEMVKIAEAIAEEVQKRSRE